jgi:adenylate cyclase
MRSPADEVDASEEWQETLTVGHSVRSLKNLKRIMRLLPGDPRCKVCNNPFGGLGGRVCQLAGFTPSRKNPGICSLCCEKMPRGGAEVETAVLFADVRGSTKLAAQLGPTRYADLLNRFYKTSTNVLIKHDATVDKLIGDEVMAFFVPGFAGPNFKGKAIAAGIDLLRAYGYGDKAGPWIPVGIGIDAGIAYVGNVGSHYLVDFTALGDPVNIAQKIQSNARAGELLASAAAFEETFSDLPAGEPFAIAIKGKEESVWVRALQAVA